ncbi:MAG: ribulose-phosphate 3-epimerase [Nitrospinota bacterium]
MVKVAPSILSADFRNLAKEIKAVEEAGADIIHVDVMDGHFVPNITIGPFIVEAVRKCTKLPIDVHLMTENPERHIPAFAKAGADWISVQVETCPHLQGTLRMIRDLGKKCAPVFNPSTPLDYIDHVLEDIDYVLIMSVNPGFSGQKFIPSALKKIRALKEIISKGGYKIEIEVDGGVTSANAGKIVEAGADILVAGSAVYGSDNYKEAINAIKNRK